MANNKSNGFCATTGPEKVCISSQMNKAGGHELRVTTHKWHVGVYIVVAVILLLLIGFFSGWLLKPSSPLVVSAPVVSDLQPKEVPYKEDNHAGLKSAEEKLPEETFFDTDERPINHLSGVIKSINGNNVTLEFKVTAFGIAQQDMLTRELIITNKTTIEKRELKPKDQAEKEIQIYKKAMEDYKDFVLQNPELAAESELPEQPVDYVVVATNVSDLKVDDRLRVFANVDIRNNDSFEATVVELLRRTSEPDEDDSEGEDVTEIVIGNPSGGTSDEDE